MTEALSFVLVFDDDDAGALTEYSQSTVDKSRAATFLDDKSLPHITLVQFSGEPNDAERVWGEWVELGQGAEIDISLAGVCLLPAPDDSECWIEIPILKSDPLQKLQNQILQLGLIGQRTIFNGTGDNYRPHVTIGLVKPSPSAYNVPQLPGRLLRMRTSVRVALGVSGKHYALTKLLCK